jgi:MFS family permease
LTTDYITPYALALKATATQIGWLSSVSNLFISLSQFKAAALTERIGNRKKVVTSAVLWQVLMAVPIIAVAFFPWGNRVVLLIIFVSLFVAAGAISGPPWLSLMSDHIPEDKRGFYFGWRSKVLAVVTVVFSFLAGAILNLLRHDVLKGFVIIFSLALVFRFLSWYCLTRMYEPPLKITREDYFSFWDFIRGARNSNFAKFVFFVSGLNLCVNIAAPFFSVFMLRDLRFNYLTYTVVVTTVPVVSFLLIDKWGWHADKIGNMKVLKFTALLIATLPLWWIFCQHPVYLVLAQALSGFAWAGFNLCATNFIFDAVSPAKRTRCVAFFNVFNGMALCIGALLGGYLVRVLPPLLGFRILSLFLLSSILRILLVVYFSSQIKEVRQVDKISSRGLFYSMVGLGSAVTRPRNIFKVAKEEGYF